MYTILLTYPLYGQGMKLLEQSAELIITNDAKLENHMEQLQRADAVIPRGGRINRAMMEQCPRLKTITIPGVGSDTIDLDAAGELGIPVQTCPGTNLRSVAEHAVAMAYALAKCIASRNAHCKAGNYAIRNRFDAIELENHSVGIVGYGNIGRAAARLFHNNDMRVYVFDPFIVPELVDERYTYVSDLHDFLSLCDIVSLHLPLTPDTRGLFDSSAFSAMKDGAMLVNCARGAIVDEDALYDALVSGKLGAAALDVMESEPFNPDNRLLSLENVIVTPHVASVTREAAERTYGMAVNTTLAVLNGEQSEHTINKAAYTNQRK